MNKEQIIQMAREAGLDPDLWNYTDAFERFATLVAAAERSSCVETLLFLAQAAQEDDPEWADVAFWCCSRINNPLPSDVTLTRAREKV